jgi:hypothetical protein
MRNRARTPWYAEAQYTYVHDALGASPKYTVEWRRLDLVPVFYPSVFALCTALTQFDTWDHAHPPLEFVHGKGIPPGDVHMTPVPEWDAEEYWPIYPMSMLV